MPGFFDDLDTDPMASASAKVVSLDAERIRREAHVANGGESQFPCPSCGGKGYKMFGYRTQRRHSCFKCNGSGKVGKRVIAAAKAKTTREANLLAWRQENADLLRAIEEHVEWNEFMRSLRDQALERPLSENQVAAARTSLAKIAAKREEKRAQLEAERNERSGAVNVTAIEALFARAVSNDIKRPVFRAEGLEISLAPKSGVNAGALYVKSEGDVYLGKIAGGVFHARREAPAGTLETLLVIAADPTAAAIKYGRRTGRCGCCGRGLVDPVSIRSGIGPVCAVHWGLDFKREWARDELRAEAVEEAAARARGDVI
jgi:hypothetical protein